MTAQPRNRKFGSRLRAFADYVDGIVTCAAAVEAGRKPSRRALSNAGLDPNSFDDFRRF